MFQLEERIEGKTTGAKSLVIRPIDYSEVIPPQPRYIEHKVSEISKDVFDLMLNSYTKPWRLVKEAKVEYVTPLDSPENKHASVEGDVEIPYTLYAAGAKFNYYTNRAVSYFFPNSSFLRKTGSGHFNLTESGNVFNQLAYVFFAERIRLGIAPELRMRNMQELKDNQMGGCLIRGYEFDFEKTINPTRFKAKLSIDKMKAPGDAVWYWLNVDFYDDKGGKANAKCKALVKKGKA